MPAITWLRKFLCLFCLFSIDRLGNNFSVIDCMMQGLLSKVSLGEGKIRGGRFGLKKTTKQNN